MKGRAFSSEVETGSRQENASNQESRAPFRFHRNGKGSSGPITRRGFVGGTLLAGLGGKALAQGFAGLGESAPPAKARRDIFALAFIGKDPDQGGRLHTREPDHRQQRRAECCDKRDRQQFDQLQREDMERQPPAERLHVDDRNQAPGHQQPERYGELEPAIAAWAETMPGRCAGSIR